MIDWLPESWQPRRELAEARAEIERLRPFEERVCNGATETGWHIMTEEHYAGLVSAESERDALRTALGDVLAVLREGCAPITLWAATDAWAHHEQIPESTAPAYPLYAALTAAERLLGEPKT